MTIELASDLCRLADAHGRRTVEAYRSGRSNASRAFSINGADLDPRVHAESRRAECACAQWLGLDPYEVLDWSDHADDGKDIDPEKLGGLRVDVKSTGPNGRLLIWPISKNPIYVDKKFHVLEIGRAHV